MRDYADLQPVLLRVTFISPFFSADAVPGPVRRIVGQVRSPSQTLAHQNISGQGGPNYGPGGNSNDQKPPDHPHDALGYQKREFAPWRDATFASVY